VLGFGENNKMKNTANYIAQSMKTLLDSHEYQRIFRTASSLEEKEEKDESEADDKDLDESKDESYADDKDKEDADDCGSAEDGLEDVTANYDIAIDSLLTASAALDELNSPTGSAATIKLAHIIVNAKKMKVEELKKSKKDKEKAKKDKDKNQAKGKMPAGLKKHLEEKAKNKSKKDDKKDLKKGKK